jgi:Arc/MetJ-type ribon-helix-helix transcriptional regulator
MKMSISLPDEDVEFVDQYANRRGMTSRSSVLHKAIDLLRESELESAYQAAFDEWQDGSDARLWDKTTGDGLTDAAR